MSRSRRSPATQENFLHIAGKFFRRRTASPAPDDHRGTSTVMLPDPTCCLFGSGAPPIVDKDSAGAWRGDDYLPDNLKSIADASSDHRSCNFNQKHSRSGFEREIACNSRPR